MSILHIGWYPRTVAHHLSTHQGNREQISCQGKDRTNPWAFRVGINTPMVHEDHLAAGLWTWQTQRLDSRLLEADMINFSMYTILSSLHEIPIKDKKEVVEYISLIPAEE